ncbi:hypothetical protein PoB_004389200 [Plakobranchus ocellatus]|uniref:Uncharacterized protein n=1 Tax=Plakobranchus ocellatus TaxID=259542 RepID=A0AAV4BEL1_9GAST|nr:hypothetical protein PoB_004389200 [Plakobranchus ocellatus]
MDFGGEGVKRQGGRWRTLGFLRRGEKDLGLEREGGHSTGEAEALGKLGVKEPPQIEDIVFSASMARDAKQLNVSLGASCLFNLSALRLADVSVFCCSLGTVSRRIFLGFPLGQAEGALLPPSLGSAAGFVQS